MRAPGEPRWRPPSRASLLTGGVAGAVYLLALRNGFAYDDVQILVDNAAMHHLRDLLVSLGSPWWPGPEGAGFGLWRPLSTLLLGVQWVVFGGRAWGFHLVNLLLHVACTVLVVRVGARLLPQRVALTAGLVFAVHPVHVEAVANVVGFAELLAALLSLGAVALLTAPPVGDGTSVPTLEPGRQAAIIVLFGAASLAKEHAMVLPALLVGVEAMRFRLRLSDLPAYLRRRGLLLASLGGVAALVLWGRMAVLGQLAAPVPPLGGGLLLSEGMTRIFTLGEIWGQYLRLLLVPLWLSPDYAPAVIPVLTVWTPAGMAAVGAVLALLLAGLWSARQVGRTAPSEFTSGGAVPLGLLWFVVTILPVSNALFLSGVFLAERTLYLPSVGVAWMMGAGLVWVTDRRRRGGLVLAVVLGSLWVGRTVTAIPVWRDTLAVFDHMVNVVPQSGRSQWVLGDALLDAGQVDAAVAAYTRALGLLGGEVPFLSQSGRRLHAAGATRVGRLLVERAWVEDPTRATTAQLLTVLSAQDGDWTATETWARQTLELGPDDGVAWHLLSVALAEQGEWAAARDAREALIERDGGAAWQNWFWLIPLRARAGDADGARAAADSARARTSGPLQLRQIDSVLVAALGGTPPL